MHRLLARQLRKHTIFQEDIPPELKDFILAIENAYCELDEEKKLLERSLEISSNELFLRNQELSNSKKTLEISNDRLEEMVLERTQSLKKALEDAEQSRNKAIEANKSKSEFLANISHELRTPLNSILVLADNFTINSDNNLSIDQVTEAKIIYECGSDLLNLIDDILDLTKVEAGKLLITNEDVTLNNLINNLKTKFIPLAEKKKLSIKINIGDMVPTFIKTDPLRLEQIIRNFISNAIKFTSNGSITINIQIPNENTQFKNKNLSFNNVVAISVEDTGIGIAENQKEIIFEAFKQADSSASRKYGGTGLGLSISLSLSNLLGGEIAVESICGIGSKFTLFLPKAIDLKSLDENISATEDEDSLENIFKLPEHMEGMKALVIDDNSLNIFVLSKLLKNSKLNILTGTNGKEAIEILERENDIAIVFMDLMMPEMSGYEAVIEIRSHEKFKDLPVIAATAKAMRDDKQRCLDIGFNDYITKPINKAMVIEKLKKYLPAAQ
jgi:two-component system chemotaxis sensor kinase CheA